MKLRKKQAKKLRSIGRDDEAEILEDEDFQQDEFKELKKDKHREAFLEMLIGQQSRLGKYRHWAPKYLRKCLKKKVKPLSSVRDAA